MKAAILFCTLLSYSCIGNAQQASEICAKEQRSHTIQGKTTAATIEENDYDVKHLAFDIELSNLTTAVSGSVTTTAKVVATSMATYAFELSNDLTIDSIKFNNILVASSAILSAGSVRKVILTTSLPNNAIFTAQVYYHGLPPNGAGFFTRGLNHATLPSGTDITYTLSDIDLADDWWPSKQVLQDKIDSVDMWVTVPNGTKAGSNGLLKNVTPLPGKDRYEWKTRYAIDYYLISVSVAPYSDYSYYMHYTDGSGDSMLIQNYVYDSVTYMPSNKAAFDTTGLIVDYFSKKFGRYPFDKEKYGHCIVDPFLSGGMEHQTMTTIAFVYGTIIAHELGHQWWGDHVTYSTWSDIWLSEGFASYCEQLFVEHFSGPAAFKIYRGQTFGRAMLRGDGSVFVDDTTNATRIFDGTLTYDKGASVVHMLRYMAPKDEDFFTVLQNYQQQHAFGFASTNDLKSIAEQVYGRPLDTFFNQWIYKEGYPVYGGKWYQDGNQFYLQINQTVSDPSSISYFTMPVEVLLRSASGDTTIKVYNNAVSQNFTLPVGRKVSDVVVDPNYNILHKSLRLTQDPTLSVDDILGDAIEVYPNPCVEGWNIKGLKKGMEIYLSDIEGAIKWKSHNMQGNITIPATGLAAGNYTCTFSKDGVVLKTIKLAKQ